LSFGVEPEFWLVLFANLLTFACVSYLSILTPET